MELTGLWTHGAEHIMYAKGIANTGGTCCWSLKPRADRRDKKIIESFEIICDGGRYVASEIT